MAVEKLDLGVTPKLNVQGLARRNKNFMVCFLPEPGCKLVAADVDAAEPAVVAHYAQDRRYLFATRDGKGKEPYVDSDDILMIDDVYLMFGSSHILSKKPTMQAFEKRDWGREAAHQWIMSRVSEATPDTLTQFVDRLPESYREHYETEVTFIEQWLRDSDVVKDYGPLKRKHNKDRALALIYGLGIGSEEKLNGLLGKEFERGFPITRTQAKSIYDGYWKETFPGNKRFKQLITAKCKEEKCIVNAFGFRATPLPRKAFNYLIQSSVSGLVKVFCYLFFGNLAPWCVYHAVIHDEIIFSCPEDRVEEAKKLFYQAQKQLNNLLKWNVEMTFGWKVRDNWFVK